MDKIFMNAHDILPTIGKTSQLVYVDTMRNRWDWARPADESMSKQASSRAPLFVKVHFCNAACRSISNIASTSPNGMCSR
jgi:hypothetical protein